MFKTGVVRVLNGFKNEPFYEFIGEVILKINLVWNTKTSEKFIKNSVVLSSWIINEFFWSFVSYDFFKIYRFAMV